MSKLNNIVQLIIFIIETVFRACREMSNLFNLTENAEDHQLVILLVDCIYKCNYIHNEIHNYKIMFYQLLQIIRAISIISNKKLERLIVI